MHKKSLGDIKWWTEKYLNDRLGKEIIIQIHYTTELDKVKANVQGKNNEYDIVISGNVSIENILEAVAHEVAHIIMPEEDHSPTWKKEKELVLEFLKNKLS